MKTNFPSKKELNQAPYTICKNKKISITFYNIRIWKRKIVFAQKSILITEFIYFLNKESYDDELMQINWILVTTYYLCIVISIPHWCQDIKNMPPRKIYKLYWPKLYWFRKKKKDKPLTNSKESKWYLIQNTCNFLKSNKVIGP